MNTMTGYIYLIHFDKPLAGRSQHYIGRTSDIARRIKQHQKTRTIPAYVAEFAKQGIDIKFVTFCTGTRSEERKLKNRKNAKQLCPCCLGIIPNEFISESKKMRQVLDKPTAPKSQTQA